MDRCARLVASVVAAGRLPDAEALAGIEQARAAAPAGELEPAIELLSHLMHQLYSDDGAAVRALPCRERWREPLAQLQRRS
jgi:hypothetical protein